LSTRDADPDHQRGIISPPRRDLASGVAFDRSSLRRMKSHGLRHKAQGLRIKTIRDSVPSFLAPCALSPAPHISASVVAPRRPRSERDLRLASNASLVIWPNPQLNDLMARNKVGSGHWSNGVRRLAIFHRRFQIEFRLPPVRQPAI
jgi:hypothetical protein